jgi:mannose-6-phosphate isomerase-like protein (cupin superfamily)
LSVNTSISTKTAVIAAAVALAGYALMQPAPAGATPPILINHDDPGLEWVGCPEFIPEGCRIAVLQGDPAGHNADIFFKLPPDFHVPHHWHTSAERMILVSGEFHVNYDGHPPVVMRPGTYAYGPAKLPHDAYCAPGDPCVLFIAFEEPVDAVPTQE